MVESAPPLPHASGFHLIQYSTLINIGGSAAWLDDEENPAEVDTLRHHTRTDRPLGGEAILDLLS